MSIGLFPEDNIGSRSMIFQRVLGGYIQSRGDNLSITSAYTPNSNGAAERSNQPVEIIFWSIICGSSIPYRQWDRLLPEMQFAFNTAPLVATQQSPFLTLFGVEADTTLVSQGAQHTSAADFLEMRKTIRSEVRDVIG